MCYKFDYFNKGVIMKKILLMCGLLTSSFSFGASWTYVTSSNAESFWIDKAFYKYDPKSNTVDVWSRSDKSKANNEVYTSSKSLERYSCGGKKSKNLAYAKYNENGEVIKSITKPESEFSIIFPDTIAEAIWSVACSTKGKGFKFTKRQLETVSLLDLEREQGPLRRLTPEEEKELFPNGPHGNHETN